MAMSSFNKDLVFYLLFKACVISRSGLKIRETRVDVNWANWDGCNHIFFTAEVLYR